MYKTKFICPTCDKMFQRQITGQLSNHIPSIHYCSIECNTQLERVSKEMMCECGTVFDSYNEQAKCMKCQLPISLRDALAIIEEEFGSQVV